MSSLAAILKRETELIARFKGVLLREREILRSGKIDGLAEINEEKLSLVDTLNQVGIERTHLISPSSATTVEMQAWLSAHPREIEAAMLWNSLLLVARETRDLNESNGRLINVLHQKTSDALSFLTQGNADQSLYGSNGQSALNTGSRIIDSA